MFATVQGMDLRRLRELTEATTRAQGLLARSDFLQAGERVRTLLNTSKFVEATLAGAEAAKYAPDPSHWLPRHPDISLMARQIERTQHHYAAIFNSTSFVSVLDEIERVRPIIAQYQRTFVDDVADDEPAARMAAALDFARVLFEGTTGISTRLTTKRERWLFFIAVVTLLFTISRSCHSDAQSALEHVDLRRVQAEQGRLISALTDALREVDRQHHQDADLPIGPLLLVTDTARLRLQPSPEGELIGRFEPGTRLELIVPIRRWFYVEVLSAEGHRTGSRGWVYRRVVRHER